MARTLAIADYMRSVFRRRDRMAAALVGLGIGGLAILAGVGFSDDAASRRTILPSIESWPHASRLARNPESPTLIMFAHERCACTTTSLTELRELMSRFEGRVRAYVLFAEEEEDREEPPRTDNWITARSIHGVTVLVDQAGQEASLFDATTSGQVMLYDVEGRLAFDGGIAPMRGQRDTPLIRGLASAIELASAGKPIVARVQMPNAVSGCSLRGGPNAISAGAAAP